jgi:DNA replication protein DnaC
MNDANNNADSPISCLFISVPLLSDLALARVRGKDDRKIDCMNHIEKSFRKADLLVLDDLGSESNMQTSYVKEANQTSQKILFELADSRKGKVTLITTNYASKDLQEMYNGKIISRLFTKNPEHVINFDELPDRRILQN